MNAVAVRGVDDVVVETVEVAAQLLGPGVDVVKGDPRSLRLLSSRTIGAEGQPCGITLLPTRAGA
jgi:hypothetical protein